MEKEIGIYDAKTHFSSIINQVSTGQVFIVCRSGVPQAKIVPVKLSKKRRKLGSARGEFKLTDTFFDPLPKDILKGFS